MANGAEAFKLVKAGRLIDGRSARPLQNGAVLVEGTKIRQVGRAADVRPPEGATVEEYDFPMGTLLPGLIDAHVHFNYLGNGMHTDDVMDLDDDILLMRSILNARVHLESGVTTIRDCGAKHRTTFSLREGVRQGLAAGPRMLLCGRPVTITGGHMWQMGSEADGTDGVRTAVRQLVRDGADWIKVPASGGSTFTSLADRPSFNVEELRAIVDEAHKFGKLVGTHCTATQATINSLDAGVDMIIHGAIQERVPDGTSRFRQDIAERIAREGRPVNATLHIGRARLWMLQQRAEATGESPAVPWGRRVLTLDGMEREHERALDTARRLDQLGVRLIPGSDAGFGWYPLGHFVWELECHVDAGLSPMKTIQAATRDAADAIGVADITGTLEPGKAADLLVVDGNPAQDIMALDKVQAVFLEGAKVT